MVTNTPTLPDQVIDYMAQEKGLKSINNYAKNDWYRNWNVLDLQGRLRFYPSLLKALSALRTSFDSFPRLVEKFARVDQGDGSEAYLLSAVQPGVGKVYNAEFNSDEAAKFLLGQHRPNIISTGIGQLREYYDAVTVKEDQLAASYEDVVSFGSQLIQSLENGDRQAEWQFGLSMLFEAVEKPGLAHRVLGARPTDENTAREFSARLGGIAEAISSPTDLYNPARLQRVAVSDDLVFVTRISLKQTLFKSQYSGTFQMGYAQGLKDDQLYGVPDELWPASLSHVQGILISKGGEATVRVIDNVQRQDTFNNGAWDATNHFLTHKSVTGISSLGIMVVFEDGTPVAPGAATPVPATEELTITLNGVEVTELVRGVRYDVRAVAKDANKFIAGPSEVAVSGNNSPAGRTYVTVDDFSLFVGIDEESAELTITAHATLDPTVTAEVTLPVVGERFEAIPPYASQGTDAVVNLTASKLATFSGKTATPPAETEGYSLTYAGTVGGVAVTSTDFDAPVTLTQEGDTITITATADTGYTLTGVTTRTLSY